MKINSITHYNFEDLFQNLPEFWKEQNGLGSCSMYRIGNEYFMIHGSKCPCCNPQGQIIWKINKAGDHLETLSDFTDYDNVEEIIKFTIPERLTQHYLKVKI